ILRNGLYAELFGALLGWTPDGLESGVGGGPPAPGAPGGRPPLPADHPPGPPPSHRRPRT
ncbi:hypothetical protein ACFW2L_20215, partial [Streptomyces sp. NPDC058869]